MDIIAKLAQSTDSQMITLLLGIVVTFACVITYMYKHTQNETVPKFIWQQLLEKIVTKIKEMANEITEIKQKVSKLETKIDERL